MRKQKNEMNRINIYFQTIIILFLFSGCVQKTKNELRRLSTAETVKQLKEGKVNQFKFIYKDSLGSDLTPELSKKFNSGKMIREFYVNQANEIIEVRLKEYSHKKVFHEILIRELLNDPFKNYQFIDIKCEEAESILKHVFNEDQEVFKMFVNFRLDEHIPRDNFYRVLKDILDLSFIKNKTQFCYASKMGKSS